MVTKILQLDDYIDKAFEILPTNSFIHKGRCGIGGTTLELKTERNTIIVVPTVGIIEDKETELDEKGNIAYPDLLCVYGEFLQKDIISFFQDDISFKKIMVTPDSLPKIIRASKEIGSENELYKNFYIMLDECHSPITEKYRAKMVEMIEIFFLFEKKIVMSATPYYFNDPRFKALQEYKITFYEDYLGEVSVIYSPSIQQTIDLFLTEKKKTSGNIHIFYNSVTEIVEAIKRTSIEDCNIYCADEVKNRKTLADLECFFKAKPMTGEYKKFNFYTTRYFEGWSLRDINPTIILVTDVHKQHTRVGIRNKGVQAIGRVRIDRNKPNSAPECVYHITNHRKIEEFKSLEEFTTEYFSHARYFVKEYNQKYRIFCNENNLEPLEEKRKTLLNFATIDENGDAILNYTKTDQIINDATFNEEFNHIDFIHNAWRQAGFNTIPYKHYEVQPAKENKQRVTAKMLKAIFEEFKQLDPQKRFRFFFGENENSERLEYLKSTYPILYEAYKKLPESEIIEVKYNIKKLEKLLILSNNKDTDIAIKKLLNKYFTVGQRYTIDEINNKLQEVYNYVGRKEKPNATDLKNNNWYEVKPCKIPDKKNQNKTHNGYIIQRKTFEMKVTTE